MLSIIIPAKNEEKYLPLLLESIKSQNYKVFEVIVADNNSIDKTKKIAKKYNCKIIKGGLLDVAKNHGARTAKGDILLFLDADMILPPGFIKTALEEFKKRKLDLGGALVTPIKTKNKIKTKINEINYSIVNFFIKFLQYTKILLIILVY